MHRSFQTLNKVKLALLVAATLTFTVGCGGGGGGMESGNVQGTDSAPRVIGLQTPSGLQGTRGVNPDHGWVDILYSIQDREYDWCDVAVEYGYDHNGDGSITDGTDDGFGSPTPNEFAPATAAPEFDSNGVRVHDGVGPLNSSPGAGALHAFSWDSVADIGTKRFLTQDYVYTTDGRIDRDLVTGDIRFEVFPGVVLRVKPSSGSSEGAWVRSAGMSVNNNNTPAVVITGADLPPEGEDDGTVNEHVAINWTAVDPDSDAITIAVDIAVLDNPDDYGTMTPEELETLPWVPATTSTVVGEGTFLLASNPAPGIPHQFGWNSLSDVQQQRIPVLVRIRPLDAKREQGEWVYAGQHLSLDNYTTFMNPTTNQTLPEGRVGAVATTLDTGNVLVTGGSSAGDNVGLSGGVVYYVLEKNPYGNVGPTTNSLIHGRTHHTATRLLAEDAANPNDSPPAAKVLIAGGFDQNGNPRDTAEIYDPATNRFTPLAATLTVPRANHSAVLLRSGKVLILGGVRDKNGNAASYLDTAELFDPATGGFTLIRDLGDPGAIDKKMNSARADAGALVLPADLTQIGGTDRDGTDLVLIAGGRDQTGALASIEIFDALTETFLATDSANDMAQARWGLSLTPTMDQAYAAVAAGGMASPPKDTIEVFDQASRTWKTSLAKMATPRAFHSGALMGDGRILLAGGQSDEAGENLNGSADLYNPTLEAQTREVYDDPKTPADESVTGTPASEAAKFVSVPNGELPAPNRNAATTVLNNGFVAIIGGDTATGATNQLQLFAPDQGFNTAPKMDIRSPNANTPEPWAFGVRIYFRLIDAEGDPARIVAQYKVLNSANAGDATNSGDWLTTRKDDIGKWLPATMQANTVLGDISSGTSGLITRTDEVNTSKNPIDNPGATEGDDLGEHLFVWNSSLDIPKGDYDNVFFRIISYGAVQGETATTSRFGMTKNAPVILRIQKPVQDLSSGTGSIHGNIVVPFYIQDSDSILADSTPDDLARVVWQYGVDANGDGKVIEERNEQGELLPGSEVWLNATQSTLDETINGTVYPYEDQTTLVSEAGGDLDANGYPQGALHHWIWNSVYDIGAPVLDPVTGEYSRKDIFIRGIPYDYQDQSPASNPADEADQSAGIGMERGHDATNFPFEIERDPMGLWIDDWYPTTNNTNHTAPYLYNGVKVDEPIRFEFTDLVDPATINKDTLVVKPYGGGTQIAGFYHVMETNGRTVVDFWPQAQEKPTRTDVPANNTGYSLEIPAYDPSNRSRKVIQRKGADADDTNALNLLTPGTLAMAFKTGTGALVESVAPNYESMALPSPPANVPVGTKLVQLRFDDRLDPLTITPSSFEVYAENAALPGVKTVIPGTVLLENHVDLSGQGGALAKYGVIKVSLPSNMTLPPGSTIKVVVKTGVTDLAGNKLSQQASPSFDTSATTKTNDQSYTEEFEDDTYLDAANTTAAWGLENGDFDGDAVDGYLMGLFEFGDGSDGAFTSGTTLTSDEDKSAWNYTSFSLPSGHTLYLQGDRPISIRSQGAVDIRGIIQGTGGVGNIGGYYGSSSTSEMRAGGKGVAGGGGGGSSGKYTSGQTSSSPANAGGNAYGFSSGGGSPGPSYHLAAYVTYYPTVPGGGGGGHGSAGTKGEAGYTGLGLSPGAGGPVFGDSALSNGPEGGAGGGAGGNVTSSYGWTGAVTGGTGGGGGAALEVYSLGKITLYSTGSILCNGGDGAKGTYYYNSSTSNRYNAGGGGGGASGGSIHLTAPEFALDGPINVQGGAAGASGSATTSYANAGGAGGGGRIRVSTSATLWMKSGVVTTGTSTLVVGGSYTTDWTISTDTKVDTDLGITGIYDKTSGEFRVKNFTVKAGTTLTVTGTKPLKIIASGDVDIQGTIVAEGGRAGGHPERDKYETYLSSNTSFNIWYQIYSSYAPGPTWGEGGPGGGRGGNNGATKSLQYSDGWYSQHTSMPVANPGYGWDGKSGGKGAGLGGKANAYTGYATYYIWYYYSGAGSGGTCAAPGGTAGWNATGGSFGSGTSAKPQTTTSDFIDLSLYLPTTIVGGAGGGGGSAGGYIYQSGSYRYYYPQGAGAGGGGGGGGVGIAAAGYVDLGGVYKINGGEGGGQLYYTAAYMGAGGGGSGGNFYVHSMKGITFSGPVINAAGGIGGWNKMYTYTYYPVTAYGGDGGPGSMRFTQPPSLGAPELPGVSLDPSKFVLGGGSLSAGPLNLSTDAVSSWIDTLAFASKNFEWDVTGNDAIAEFWLEGAQSHPLTGDADPSNTTGWVKLGSGTVTHALDGYRYFRFKVVLKPVLKEFPEIDSVTIYWQYDS